MIIRRIFILTIVFAVGLAVFGSAGFCFASTETLRPNGTGSETAIIVQYPAEGNHYDKVDEEVTDDNTTYVENNELSTWKRDLYALPAHSGSGTINNVTVYARLKTTFEIGSLYSGKISIKTNGVTYNTSAYILSGYWEIKSNIWTTNPQTGNAWTWDEIDSLEIGFLLYSDNMPMGPGSYSYTLATQVYAVVDYTTDIAAPTISTLSPTDNAPAVAIDSNLVITFSEAVDAETGNISLYKTVGDVLVQAFNVTTDITGTGTTTITANPASNLLGETAYYVKIDATAFDDAAGNSFAGITDTTTWNFTSADIAAPTRSSGSPSGSQSAGTTQITMSLTTNENATCKYSSTTGTAYGSMISNFSSTGETSHSVAISDLSNGQSYNYYIRCQDDSNNANSDDYTISFSVASPLEGVVLPSAVYNLPSAPMDGFKITINQGVNTTTNRTVTLNFNANSDVKKMAISLTDDFSDAVQENYSSTKQIDLCSKFNGLIKNPACPDRQYTIYVKFYTQYGVASNPIATKITLSTTPTKSITQNTVSAVFTKPLSFGMTLSDVRRLQSLLATKSEIYPEGLITGYFGPLTEKAVQAFQLNYGIVSSKADPGFGYVGPKTRAKLQEIFSK